MKLKNDCKVRSIAGENVIVRIGEHNVNMTRIVSLNDTSLWLWNELQGKEFDAKTVAGLLTSQYEVTEEVALADAQKWIESLVEADLTEE